MIEVIGWVYQVVYLITIPSLAIIGVLFHKQRKTRGSLLLVSGLIAIFLSMIIGFIFPQTLELTTVDEAQMFIVTEGPPLRWFIDEIVNSIAMVITVMGFGLVVFEDRNSNTN